MITFRKYWEVVGATFHASAYCVECAEALPEIDPEGNPKRALLLGEITDDMEELWSCDSCGSSCADW